MHRIFQNTHTHLTRSSLINNKEITDTSTSAEYVQSMGVTYAGVICDADAAALRGIPVVETCVANKEDNYTTFFLYRK